MVAYALHPAVERLAARRVPRVLAVSLVVVAAIIGLLALLLLVVPILSKELPLLREQIPLLADRLNRFAAPWLAQMGVNVALDVPGIKAMLLKGLDGNLEDWVGTALSSARIGGSIVLTVIGNAVLVPVVDYTEPEGVERPKGMEQRLISSGTFALQGHDPKSKVYFKNIKVKAW